MPNPTPDLLGQAVGPIFARLETREQRVLLAVLERMAAETYRGLAAQVDRAGSKAGLLRAADNEDGIADTLQELEPEYRRIETDLHQRFPQLDGLFDSVMQGRPFTEQLRLQRAAEFGAAGLFRSLAEAEPDLAAKQKLMACSATEQANADFLAQELGEL